jgi:hypothetical protein
VWVGKSDELFNPSTAQWNTFGQPSCISGNEHCGGGAAMLTNGQVLITGGTVEVKEFVNGLHLTKSETITAAALWDPTTLGWTSTGDLVVSPTGQSMTRLSNGQILVAGGESFDKGSGRLVPIANAELYTP